MFRVRCSVTVRGLDTHLLRNWPNASNDNALCVWITGEGREDFDTLITWPSPEQTEIMRHSQLAVTDKRAR